MIEEIVSIINGVKSGIALFPLGPAAGPVQAALSVLVDLLRETGDVDEAIKAIRARGYKDAQNELNKLYGQ